MKKMKYTFIGFLAIIAMVLIGLRVYPLMAQEERHVLDVPFVAQVSDGAWVLPWSEACEEASLTMIEAYYTKQSSVPVSEARQRMQEMIAWENETFKKNQDTQAEQIVQLINHQGVFAASVVRRPTVEQIIEQVQADRPVIFLVNMYQLYQEPNQGDSFHVGVIVGVDEKKQQFLVHDPARQANTAYPYAQMMDALHDYNETTREADGEPTVVFTAPLASPASGAGLMKWIRLWMSTLF